MFARILFCIAVSIFAPSLRAAIDLGREMILTPVDGVTSADCEIRRWQQQIATNGDAARYERLGWAFVTKARQTLDSGFYKLAEKTADVMDSQFGPSPEAALLRGHVFHNLHRFHDAEIIARRLVAQRGTANDWALLSDALMEQGKLAEAIAALQQMVNLKPGPEASARIAHVRWLKGDLRGAVAAMEQAARETSPDDAANLAWMYARVAGLCLQLGDLNRADIFASAAIKAAPDFPPSLLATGKVKTAQHDFTGAISLLRRAAELNPLPEYQWWLADAYRAAGDPAEAAAVESEIKAQGESADPRTLVLFDATRGQVSEHAITLARAELENRGDIHSHDALAWALYRSGDVAKAAMEIERALSEGTRDPRIHLHAALIAQANDRGEQAKAYAGVAQLGSAALLPSERELLSGVAAKCGAPASLTAASAGDAVSARQTPYTTQSLCAGTSMTAPRLLSP